MKIKSLAGTPMYVGFTAFFVAVCLLGVGTRVEAQEPSWAVRGVDTSVFRYVVEVAPLDVPVPTAAEIVLPQSHLQFVQGVAVDSVGSATEVHYQSTEATVPLVVEPSVAIRNTGALLDSNFSTYVSFPFTEQTVNRSTLIINAPQTITTRELRLALPVHVALPYKVAIRGTTVDGAREVLLARSSPTGTTIRFPEATLTRIELEVEYTQPLRIAELTVVPVVPGEVTRSLRFLAQPHTAYRVYFDADRSFTFPSESTPGLRDAEPVTVLDQPVVKNNTSYVPADSDSDGIPDMYDNCVQHANPDQRDADQNGRGDACDDFDFDRILNASDNCPTDPNPNQADTDGDGVGDVCDTEESRFTEQNPWVPWAGMGIAVLVLLALFYVTARESRRTLSGSQSEQVPADEDTDVLPHK